MWLASRSPGTLIVDGESRVKERFFESFDIERNTVSSLLIKLGDKVKGDGAVTEAKTSTVHLGITT